MKLALSSDAHTHNLLIPPLSVALIYFQARGAHFAWQRERWLGLILLTAALVLRGFTRWDVWPLLPSGRLSLSIFALVMWWIGSVILCLGLRTFRSFLFPLCFLFLITPFPEHVLNWITEFPQQQTPVPAGALFRIAWVPVTREGIMLSIPGLDIEVASECSSIRSSMMDLVTTRYIAAVLLGIRQEPCSETTRASSPPPKCRAGRLRPASSGPRNTPNSLRRSAQA